MASFSYIWEKTTTSLTLQISGSGLNSGYWGYTAKGIIGSTTKTDKVQTQGSTTGNFSLTWSGLNSYTSYTCSVEIKEEWSSTESGNTIETKSLTTTTDPAKVYVYYNGNGATSGSVAADETYQNNWVNLKSNGFTRTGYSFVAWNTNSDYSQGTDYAPGAEFPGNHNILGYSRTVYVHWYRNKVTFTYNNNGGSGSISNTDIWYGDSDNISNGSGFTKTGYIIESWNTKSDGSGTTYTLGQSISAASYASSSSPTIALYAQWAPANKITIKVGAGTGSIKLVSGSREVTATDSTGAYLYINDNVSYTVTATPSTDWILSKWTINGVDNTNNPIEGTATSDVVYIAYFLDYYTVYWSSSIPDIVQVISDNSGNYPAGNPEVNKFIPDSQVTFTAVFKNSLTEIIKDKLYKDSNNFYEFNNWEWYQSSTIGNTNPITVTINRSGTVKAIISSEALTEYTLGTNYGTATINGKNAYVESPAKVKLAKNKEYITLTASVDDSNITFVHWEDENGNVLSSDPTYTFLAGVITTFWAIYRINGKQAYVLAPNDFQAIAQPVYIKNGLITENNTRFMSIKYPEFVDWEEVEQITGKKPKKGDFYYMIINEAVL